MARTILIKFWVYSTFETKQHDTFPGKIPETRKIVLIFCPSSKVAPKLNDQSRLN